MTVAELNECLGRMKKIYPFDEAKTDILLERNPIKEGLVVAISTYDDETDINIELRGDARKWRLDGENLYKN